MGSRTFKYRKQRNYAYAPGEVTAGEDGKKGHQGEHGTGVYFVDYDLSNSYAIDTALQKIRNGMLPGSESAEYAARDFKSGDVFITSSLNCYVLTGSGDSMGMEYIGTIMQEKDLALNDIISIDVYDFTGTTVNFSDGTNVITTTYDSSYMAPAPTSENKPYYISTQHRSNFLMNWRCYDLMMSNGDPETSYYRDAFNKTGKWFKICVNMSDFSTYKDYRFNVMNDMSLSKSQISDAYNLGTDQYGQTHCADSSLIACLDFKKTITLPATPIDPSYPLDYIFRETIRTGTNPPIGDTSVATMFISDSFLDRLHPGNDMKVSIMKNSDASIFSCDASSKTWSYNPSIDQNAISMLTQPANLANQYITFGSGHRYDAGNSTYFSGMIDDPALSNGFSNAVDNFLFNDNEAYAYISKSPEVTSSDDQVPECDVIKVKVNLITKYKGLTIDAELSSTGHFIITHPYIP